MLNLFTSSLPDGGAKKLVEIIKEYDRTGRKLIIFCEDRFTLQLEQLLCRAIGGSFDISVCTFGRFLSGEMKNKKILSKQGSAIAIKKLISEYGDELSCFKNLSGKNTPALLYETIAQFYASKIMPEDLKTCGCSSPVLRSKIDDIALIYEKYLSYLQDNSLTDENGYLALLSENIRKNDVFTDTDAVFFGFSSFTKQGADALEAAFERCNNVYGIFCDGGQDFYTHEASDVFIRTAGATPFAQGRIEHENCRESEIIRRGIFDPVTYAKGQNKSENIEYFVAHTIEEECVFVASNIKKLVQSGMRYSDIAILTGDESAYAVSMNKVFREYKIPLFYDVRKKLSDHPLCEFVLNLLKLKDEGFTPDAVDCIVSSAYFSESEEDRDMFSAYLRKYANFRGGVKKEITEEKLTDKDKKIFSIVTLRTLQAKILSAVEEMPAKAAGFEHISALKRALEIIRVSDAVEKLSTLLSEGEKSYLEQSFDGIKKILDEAEGIIGDVVMKAGEFYDILFSGLAASEISLIPITTDCVLSGNITSSKLLSKRALFLVGLDGSVPSVSKDTAIISDKEIEKLEEVKLVLEPKISQVNARNREQTALNVCSFREKLFVSYCSDQEAEKSEIIEYISKLFSLKEGSLSDVAEYVCSERSPAIKTMLSQKTTALGSSLYEFLTDRGIDVDRFFEESNEKFISLGKQLFFDGEGMISPTKLERYFACPYANFVERGLNIQGEEESPVMYLDTGNFIHAVLERIALNFSSLESEEDVICFTQNECDKLFLAPPFSAVDDSPSGAYMKNSLKKESVRIAVHMFRQIKRSTFTDVVAEKEIKVKIGNVLVRGKVDRIDYSSDMFRIIDYKSGTVGIDDVKYYMGQKLQLPLYALAESKLSKKRAVGIYYFPASSSYKSEKDAKNAFMLNGYTEDSEEVSLASDVRAKEERDEKFYTDSKSRIISAEDMQGYLCYSALVAEKGVEELTMGNVSPSPAQRGCDYCPLKGMCAFDVGIDGCERDEKGVKIQDIERIGGKNE